MSTFYANKITLQISDTVRLVFVDERQGIQDAFMLESQMVSRQVGEAVMSLPNARALRDLLMQHIKDEPSAETVQ